jgi:hypothetical protein
MLIAMRITTKSIKAGVILYANTAIVRSAVMILKKLKYNGFKISKENHLCQIMISA